MSFSPLSIFIQIGIFFAAGVALYVWQKRRIAKAQQPASKPKQNVQEMQKLARMRSRKLNVPLTEMTRPATFDDIVGQSEGIKALRAALCGPNPQHVLIYGPPGVGKTCAARLVLEEAKKRTYSPFGPDSKFIEVDATCVRFDERAIADPLIGSVHDPIYQGAGAMGAQGIPQPKPGAVTRAHCGVLFLDEIGELHPMQMNKLLKVLEDRCVHFESAYYSADNSSIPQHIHDIFQNGLPADFRLVGATTRRPEELPPALRSRCMELFFKPLGQEELERIAENAAERLHVQLESGAIYRCALHAQSGRDAVNIMQLACGIANDDGREFVTNEDIAWVANTCNYVPRMEARMPLIARVGSANALAVSGGGQGIVMEIECAAMPAKNGSLTLNGIVEEEELKLRDRKLRRKSTARGSVENVMQALRTMLALDCAKQHISINIPGGMPVDGPSAGVAVAIAMISALSGKAPDHTLVSTGEVTITGGVRPVGGVREKLQAAERAGAQTALIPVDNWEEAFLQMHMHVIPISRLDEVMAYAFPARGMEQGRVAAHEDACALIALPEIEVAAAAPLETENAGAVPLEIEAAGAAPAKPEAASAAPQPAKEQVAL